MTAGCVEKSQQGHMYFVQYRIFASEINSNMGAATSWPGAI